jgi:hypothetical protein
MMPLTTGSGTADDNVSTGHGRVGGVGWPFVMTGLALAVGLAVTAIIGISDALPGDVLGALRPGEQATHDPGVIVTVHTPPTGVAGIQLGLVTLLLGGVPAAVLARVLARRWLGRRRRRLDGWGNVFLAGLVFQLCSLAFTAVLLLVLLWAAAEHAADIEDVLSFGGPLLLSSACSIWGLRAWRALQWEGRSEENCSICNRP